MVDVIELNKLRSKWEEDGRPDVRYPGDYGVYKFSPDESLFMPWEPEPGGLYDANRLREMAASIEVIPHKQA